MKNKNLYSPTEEETNLVLHLILELVNRETDPGEIHPCPICGNQIHVTFSVYTNRHSKEKLGVEARCDSCRFLMTLDGKVIPEWLQHP